jgi:hypothetical protein
MSALDVIRSLSTASWALSTSGCDPGISAIYPARRTAFSKAAGLRHLEATTTDHGHVRLGLNVGLLTDIDVAANLGIDEVGLYRSEFPFMARETFPMEQEQYEIYRKLLQAFAPKPVTMRTLDIGGDKPLSYFPTTDENPFLGWRGIRLTLDRPDIFLPQLRAMLRANVGLNNLRIMFPMIGQIDEIKRPARRSPGGRQWTRKDTTSMVGRAPCWRCRRRCFPSPLFPAMLISSRLAQTTSLNTCSQWTGTIPTSRACTTLSTRRSSVHCTA